MQELGQYLLCLCELLLTTSHIMKKTNNNNNNNNNNLIAEIVPIQKIDPYIYMGQFFELVQFRRLDVRFWRP